MQGVAYLHLNETVDGGDFFLYPDGPGKTDKGQSETKKCHADNMEGGEYDNYYYSNATEASTMIFWELIHYGIIEECLDCLYETMA